MRFVLGLLLAAAPMSAMAAITVPVGNASFEAQQTSSFQYNPIGGSWLFTGGAGVAHNGSAFSFMTPADGSQVAFLQGYNGGSGSISQSITGLTMGASYAVSFYAAMRPGTPVDPITVTFGTISQLFTPTTTTFTVFTTAASFVANGNSATLTFAGASSPGDIDSGLDLVSVIQTAAAPITPVTPVDEPMSAAILGAGLLGLGMIRARKA